MKLRSLGMLLALAVALFVTLACGGGDDTTGSATTGSAIPANNASSSVVDQALQDYFQQLSTILTNVDDQSRIQLHSQYPGAGSDPDQTRQYLSQFLPVTTKALSDIKSLNAPITVKDRHDKLVSVLEDLVAAETSLSNDVASINDASEMRAYFDSHNSYLTSKTDQVDAACSDLQTVANNNNIGIDLKCREAGPAPSPVSGSGTAPTPDSPADAWLTRGTEVRFGISDPSQPIEAASGLRVEAVDYALQRIDFALIGPYSGPLRSDNLKISDDLEGVCQVLRVTFPAGATEVKLSAGEKLVFTVEYACEKGRTVKFVGLFGIIFERP